MPVEGKHTATTFDECKAAAVGTIFIDQFDEGLRLIVLRGPCSLCAYVGIPAEHPLAGHSYDDLPVQVHGGLTYARAATESNSFLPEGMFWYGWDYGHSGDFSFYDKAGDSGKHWTPAEVVSDSWSGLYDFRHLLKLSEAISSRAKEGR